MRPVSAREAADAAGVRVELVWKWRSRGKLIPVDVDARGRPLFDVDDVWAVEKATRHGANAPRARDAAGRLTGKRDAS